MATQSQSKNIFELLSDNSDHEEEVQEVKKKGDEKRVRPSKKKDNSGVVGAAKTVTETLGAKPTENTRGAKHPKDGKVDKKVSAEPHPLDRRSGTGRGKEVPKQGAGRHNYGTYKDDLKEGAETQGEVVDTPVEEQEPEDNSLTLEEYLAQKQKAQLAAKQLRTEIDLKELEKLKKEGCELIEKKKENDDRAGVKQKTKKANINHIVIGNAEHAELLGVRTGLKTYSEKPRQPREEAPVRREKPVEKTEEEKPVEEGEEKKEKEQKEQKSFRGNNRGPRGGNRKPFNRENNGERKFENKRPAHQKAVNVDDDSSFPTLG